MKVILSVSKHLVRRLHAFWKEISLSCFTKEIQKTTRFQNPLLDLMVTSDFVL